MADSSIDKPEVADPSPEAPALHPEDEDTLNDGDVADRLDETNKLDETDEADRYVEVGDKPDPLHAFLDFLVYQAPNVIVQRSRRVVYNNNSGLRLHENLVERQDLRFQGFDWFRHWTWHNETSTPDIRSTTVTEGYTVRTGTETERNFSVGATFRGLAMSVGGSRKEFTEQETSRSVEVRKEVHTEPRASTSFYQKRYNFLTEVWFWQRVPAWQNHNHFGVGETGAAFRRVKRTAELSILAEEYATLLRRLSGTSTISAVTAPRLLDDPPINRQYMNITQRAKDTLGIWNIRG
ncbi:hypothetical protein MMC29_001046 [Sticta canariensis]|nr:hypothetical protein [Sticta canariensis]